MQSICVFLELDMMILRNEFERTKQSYKAHLKAKLYRNETIMEYQCVVEQYSLVQAVASMRYKSLKIPMDTFWITASYKSLN